jgi:uncharacterized protein
MNPAQIALVLVAVSLGFFAKGLTGIGGPMFAIPVLAAFEGVEFAVAVIAIPTLVANVWLLWQHRAAAGTVRRYLVPMLIAGTFGIFIGVWLLVSVDDRWLELTLACVVIVYIIWYLTNPTFQLSEQAAQRLAAPVGFVGGGMHGATGISAPVIATYTHSLSLPRTGFVFAVTVPFAVLGAVQIVSLVAVDAYDTERFFAGLLAVIPVVIVIPIASRVGERLSQQTFQVVVLVVLGVAAARLLWSVFS